MNLRVLRALPELLSGGSPTKEAESVRDFGLFVFRAGRSDEPEANECLCYAATAVFF